MSGPQRRKAYLLLSVLLNLGLLGTFKYFGFFTESLVAAFNSVGLQLHAPMVKILLPVGISFYTFQTLSYTIDIYRKQMQPSEKLIDFAAYVAFFPQLVAGPIERAKNLLPQFQAPRLFDRQKIESGALLFLWGLFKKIAIADNLAPLANAAFTDPSQNLSLLDGDRRLGFHVSNLLRFFRLFRHGAGVGADAWVQLDVEFQLALFFQNAV